MDRTDAFVLDHWRAERTPGGGRFALTARWPGGTSEVFFEVDLPEELRDGFDPSVVAPGDVAVAVGLLPAMSLGASLRIPALTDPAMMERLDRIQQRFSEWYDRLDPVRIQPRGKAPAAPSGERGGAAFFSGGVDSWYTVLEELDGIDALVSVHGFDVPLDSPDLWSGMRQRLGAAAADIDRPLVVVRTNLREFGDRFVHWATYHGAALAAVAAVLVGLARRFYIASSFHEELLHRWGSHPDLDPLWRGRDFRIVHHGVDRSRTDKVARVAEEAAARRSLRVCWKNPDGAYNCGRCQKCVRTMLALALADRLEDVETFPPVDLRRRTRKVLFAGESDHLFFTDLISAFEARRPDSPLLRDLRWARRATPVRVAAYSALAGLRRAYWRLGAALRPGS